MNFIQKLSQKLGLKSKKDDHPSVENYNDAELINQWKKSVIFKNKRRMIIGGSLISCVILAVDGRIFISYINKHGSGNMKDANFYSSVYRLCMIPLFPICFCLTHRFKKNHQNIELLVEDKDIEKGIERSEYSNEEEASSENAEEMSGEKNELVSMNDKEYLLLWDNAEIFYSSFYFLITLYFLTYPVFNAYSGFIGDKEK